MNVAGLVAAQASARGERLALVDPAAGVRLTWAELDARVTAAASAITSTGLVAGQRVAILGRNSAAWAIAWYGVLRAGLVAVPVNPQSTSGELGRVLDHSGAALLLTDGSVPLPDGRITPTLGLATDWQPGPAVAAPRDPEALAALLYTAGTSGRPRAAMLTHRALLAHCANAAAVGQLKADDVLLAVLPLFHVYGLNAVLDTAAWIGAACVVGDGLGGDGLGGARSGDVLRDEGVTVLPTSPDGLRLLLQRLEPASFASVRLALTGAAPLSEELAAAFTATTGVVVDEGYGLTEAAPGVATTVGGERHGAGHVGRLLPGVEARIDDGLGGPGTDTEPGHLWIRGANLFSGYWPDGADGPDADGWYDTGDIGYLADGELYLVDRSRELIIVHGFNVFPSEVEEVIAELPGVRSVAVVGQPSAASGERVAAFVTGEVTADDVQAHCERRLARFKRPAVVTVVDELPRGVTGKTRKGELRRMLSELAG